MPLLRLLAATFELLLGPALPDAVLQDLRSCLLRCSPMLLCRLMHQSTSQEAGCRHCIPLVEHTAELSSMARPEVSQVEVVDQLTKPCLHHAAGFMQQFAAVSSMAKPEENLAEVIKQLSGGQDPNRVQCCGHSLGGALATLGEPCHTVPCESPL